MWLFRKILFVFLLLSLISSFEVSAQWFKKKKDTKQKKEIVSTYYDQPPADFNASENTLFLEGMREYILGNANSALTNFEKVIQINPKNDAAYYQIGLILFSQTFYDNAINYAQRAYELDENNIYYYELLARIYESQLQYAKAIKVYTALIKKIKGTEEYMFDLATLYLYNDQPNEALKVYDQIENAIGVTDEVTSQKQKIYLKLNNLEAAIKEGEKLILKNPSDVDMLSKHAFLLFSNNKLDVAESIYRRILEIDPSHTMAHLGLADICRVKGDSSCSMRELKFVIESNQSDIDTKVKILFNFLMLSKSDETFRNEVLRLSELVTKMHPTEPKAFSIYGDLLYNYSNLHESLSAYRQAIKLDNTHYQIWQQIILIESELNKLDEMIRDSEAALELFPNQATLLYLNASANYQKKNFKKAVKSLERGLLLVADNKELLIQFQGLLGDAYNGAKMPAESDKAYEAVLKIESTNAHALNNYSYFLSLRGEKLEIAEIMGKKLVELFPENITYLDTYSWVLYKMNNFSAAKRLLDKAILDTNNGTILEHYGDILFKLNDVEGAILYWKKAREAGETSELIEKKITTGKLFE